MIRRLLNKWTQWEDLMQLTLAYRELAEIRADNLIRKDDEIMRLKLEYSRWGRSIIENFLRASENGVDLSGALTEALRDFDDEIARLEEHSVA